uniref:acylphosphatase n=1 Tax=Eutreptiella gymnastica TaxID=73025 RepID=A0A7S1HZN4_9EUGL|mmetsp:Transcript_11735/g.21283  ORF Transcript_11735/g.21283 Transcript_11735/m.21283 type:complete len:160 (+) Transcript_11735:57-536(+)
MSDPKCPSNLLQYHAFANGVKMTGVGLRSKLGKLAESLGVTGWSLNVDDHTVEVQAYGTVDQIHKVSHWLKSHDWIGRVGENINPHTEDYMFDHFFVVGNEGHATTTGKGYPWQADFVGEVPRQKCTRKQLSRNLLDPEPVVPGAGSNLFAGILEPHKR